MFIVTTVLVLHRVWMLIVVLLVVTISGASQTEGRSVFVAVIGLH